MKNYVIGQASEHDMKLVQMGGKVTFITSEMCYVKFHVAGIEIEYVYNINSKDKYYLERIKPYPLGLNMFDNEDDVLKIIEIDLEQFEAAAKDNNIQCFIEVGQELNTVMKKFEDMYLYYEVPSEKCDKIYQLSKAIEAEIYDCVNNSKRVYFKKEPSFL